VWLGGCGNPRMRQVSNAPPGVPRGIVGLHDHTRRRYPALEAAYHIDGSVDDRY